MVQKSVVIFGVITGIICIGVLVSSIFFLNTLLTYNPNEQLTNVNLNNLTFDDDSLTYGLMCYGYLFEISTGFDCQKYLTDNINNQENINYVNWDKSNLYNQTQAFNFCNFFKNNNICNYK